MRGLSLFLLVIASTAQAGTWVRVGEGDCPGKPLFGSAGELPEAERCTPALAGRTALCFTRNCNPGCEYVDVLTTQCRGGAELADVYTCVAATPTPTP